MPKPVIRICLGSSCFARGNEANLRVIEKYLEEHGLRDEIDLDFNCCLCQDSCATGPNITINGKRYGGIDQNIVLQLMRDLFEKKNENENENGNMTEGGSGE